MISLQNKPELGCGIYTPSDATEIFKIDARTVNRWLNVYWKGKFTKGGHGYVWDGFNKKSFNFYTLIELYTVYQLRGFGVSFQKISEARAELSKVLGGNPYPFATKGLLTDGKKIYHKLSEDTLLALDKKQQTSFKKIIETFCKKLEFDSGSNMVSQFFPLGKKAGVVVNPHHSYGRPTIKGTNTTTDVIYSLFQASESIETIARLYDIKEKDVKDAIRYKQAA